MKESTHKQIVCMFIVGLMVSRVHAIYTFIYHSKKNSNETSEFETVAYNPGVEVLFILN